VRAVLDVNVLISGLVAPDGAFARLTRRWLEGDFELVVSERLLAELKRALAYPKLRTRIPGAASDEFIDLVRATATVRPDPPNAPRRSRDSGDDYLIALAESTGSILVSGDQDILALSASRPILAPPDFDARLHQASFSGGWGAVPIPYSGA
jgi:putative PIN family toxin of toxin-antitoxin system